MQGIDPASGRRDRRAQQRAERRDLLVSSAVTAVDSQRPLPVLNAAITALFARWTRGGVSDAACAALYFLHWQIDLHATRFASRRDKDDARPDGRQWLQRAEQLTGFALDAQLQRWFERYQFRSVIPNASVALNHWLGGKWPLHLLRHIPTPREVLSMQVRGVRPVTLIADRERMHQPVLTKANGFVFMVHDLEHAYKFFHDPKLNVMQRNLFAALEHACAAGLFFDDLSDAEFAARFDYLIGDMNTHPVHGLQYLRAILVERYLHREGGHLTPDARARVAQVLRTIGAYVDARGDVNVAFENIGLGLSRDADALAIERHLASAVFRSM